MSPKEKKYVAVTSCPSGVAHTFMAQAALEDKAKELGYTIKVETQGTDGVKNKLTSREIEEADAVIIAADRVVELDRFGGKKVLLTSTAHAIKSAKDCFEKADAAPVQSGEAVHGGGENQIPGIKGVLVNVRTHLTSAVGWMLPFIVAGGVLLAVSVMLLGRGDVPQASDGYVLDIWNMGLAGLTLFVPILGGFIAYSIADRPGLAPGMIGTWIINTQFHTGFLGAIVVGFIAGYIVLYLKKIPFKGNFRSLGTIFVYPLLGTFLVSGIVIWIIGVPLGHAISGLNGWLTSMSDASKYVLGAILGGMTAFDMGGPVNKVATMFAQAQVGDHPYLMGGVGVAICTPPLGMFLATITEKLTGRKLYDTGEKEAGKAALIMGLVGITEGAIPFAAEDPLRVIPSLMIGSIVGNIVGFALGVLNHAPWGGLIVLPVVEGRWGYLIAVLAGAITTAFCVNLLKRYTRVRIES